MTNSNRQTNVGDSERVASAIAGAALVTWSLRRRSMGRFIALGLGGALIYRGASGHCSVYQSLDRNTADVTPANILATITVGKPADELYRLWREPENLSRIMGHFADVKPVEGGRLHWNVHGPRGSRMQWDAEITEDRAGECLCWASVAGASLPNEGEVRFRPAPQNRGTEVTLDLRFKPPGGPLGKAAIKALGPTPRLLASHALRRFKSLAETGEIATIGHNPSGRGS